MRDKRRPLFLGEVAGGSSGGGSGGGSTYIIINGGGDYMPVTNKFGHYACVPTDLETTVTMNNVASQMIRLPHVDATHVGKVIECIKKGAGELVVGAEDADTINGKTYVRNNFADELYSVIRLRLITETLWVIVFMSNPLAWWGSDV